MDKEKFYTMHADMCKTISNPRRQAIINTIRDKEMTVSDIVKKTGVSQANISQHLSILRSKGLVQTRRDGNSIYYSLSSPKILKAYDLISEVLMEALEARNKTIEEVIGDKKDS